MFIVIGIMMIGRVAQAQSISVPNDFSTIQAAINAANAGDMVLVSPGTYAENITFNGKNLTVESTDGAGTTIIDGQKKGSVVTLNGEASTAMLSGFTIINGAGTYVSFGHAYSNGSHRGGGVYCKNSQIILKNLIISDNSAHEGGGVYCRDASPTFVNVRVTNNSAIFGGGVYFYNSSPTFDSANRSRIHSNHAGSGNDFYSNSKISNVVYLDNFTPSSYYANPLENFSFDALSGALAPVNADLYVSPNGHNGNSGLSASEPLKTIDYALSVIQADQLNPRTIHLAAGTYSSATNGEKFPISLISHVSLQGSGETSTILDANQQSVVVAAHYVEGPISIKYIIVTNGSGINTGGGVYCNEANLNLENLTVSNNVATLGHGGGIYCLRSNLVSTNMTVKDNKASGNYGIGGGMRLYRSTATLRNVNILNNQVHWGGGGIHVDSSSELNLTNGLFVGNSAINGPYNDGGAIGCHDAKLNLVNVTIADNSADDQGDGIHILDACQVNLVNTILWNNSPQEIYFSNVLRPSTLTVSYSNVPGGQANISTNGSDTINWLDGNLDVDPAFVGNGDYHLGDGSPLLDKGTTTGVPSTDIEGNSRPNGSGYDIGAYEKTTLDFEQRRILRRINDVGYAYVIIGLKVDNYQPEGYYDSPEGVNDQRARVAAAQSQFVSSLSTYLRRLKSSSASVQNLNIDELLNSVNTFTTVPQLFMKINRVFFDTITRCSFATNMWLNVADSASLSQSTVIVGIKDNPSTPVPDIEGTWKDGYTGTSQVVVVLDTGVDGSKLGTSKVVAEACFSLPGVYLLSDGKTQKKINPICGTSPKYKDTLTGSGKPCDLNNDDLGDTECEHGTEFARIIAANTTSIKGVAKKAQIIAIKIAGKSEISTVKKPLFSIGSQQSALEYVYTTLANTYDIAAVNMSLNSSTDFSSGPCDKDSRKPYIDNLYSLGIATIISSGNHGHKSELAKPACISSAISVGATNKNKIDSVWSDSNSADILDLLAPGVNITTTGVTYPDSQATGTSMAAPHVAGAWARLKQKLDETPNSDQDSSKHPITKIVDIIEAALKLTGKSITDNGHTFPRIQIDKAVDALNYHVYMGIDGNGKDGFPSSQSINWSGAAATKMVLKYLIDKTKSQSSIYSSLTSDMTADQIEEALNLEVHIDHGPNSTPDGKNDYNYGHLESNTVEDSIKKLVYWMDCVPNGGKNAPALVAINNDYDQNWRVLRGITTNSKPCFTNVNSSNDIPATLVKVTVTGFLFNNPTVASTDPGYYVYQDVNAFKIDHKMINGKFRVVVEPPFSDLSAAEAALANVELTLGSSKPNEALQSFLSAKTIRRKTRDGQNDIDLLSAVIDAIPGELLANPLLQPLVKKVKYVRNFMVDNLNTGTQYAIFALSPNEGDTATILVEINPVDGSFASATWMLQEQSYPKISTTQAEQIARQAANGNVQKIRRVWSNRLETSNFNFSYEVTFESGIIYVNSKGEVIIEGVHSIFGHIFDKFVQPIAGVTVQVMGHKNTTTDSTGYWKINGLTEDEYTLMATKTGYQFDESQDFAVGNDILRSEVKIDKPVSLLRITTIPQPRVVKQGQDLSYQITVTNAGEATLTGVVLTDELPADTSLISVTSIDGSPCETNATSVSCELADLTPGATATVNLAINNTQAANLINMAMVHSNEYPADLVKTWTEVKPYLSVSVEATPEPVLPGSLLHYTQEIDLNHYAPITTATGIKLVSRLPHGVELQSINSDYANCDARHLPTITCDLSDLSIENADNVSHISVNFDVMLTDLGLLLLTLESTLTAQEYPPHNVRTSTAVNVGDAEVDMVFVLDVTHSMQGEINGVIRAVKELLTTVDKNTWPLIALITFRDDVMVKAVTQDSDLLIKAIDNIQVSGGGTCPEASAEALKIAIKHTKAGGIILLATDASPYNSADIEELVTRLLNKGIRLNAIITGDCTMKESWNVIPVEERL